MAIHSDYNKSRSWRCMISCLVIESMVVAEQTSSRESASTACSLWLIANEEVGTAHLLYRADAREA
jgi:hypothetical protein